MKQRSTGFRLTAWYFLVLGCGLGAFSVMAWFAMQASIYHAIDDELRDRVRGVAKFMDLQTASLSVSEIRDEFREHSVLDVVTFCTPINARGRGANQRVFETLQDQPFSPFILQYDSEDCVSKPRPMARWPSLMRSSD